MDEENGERKLVRREVKKPAKEYPLGSKSTYQEVDESVSEEDELPHCHRCRKPLENDYVLCTECDKPLCRECALFYDGRPYCHEHIKGLVKAYDIQEGKVLVCIYNRVMDNGKVAELTKTTKTDVERSFAELFALGYTTKSRFLLWDVWDLTDEGMEDMPILYDLHKDKNSMRQFIRDLKEHMAKKNRAFRSPDLKEDSEDES